MQRAMSQCVYVSVSLCASVHIVEHAAVLIVCVPACILAFNYTSRDKVLITLKPKYEVI